MNHFKHSEKQKNPFLDIFVICCLLVPVIFGILVILSIIFKWYQLGLASLLVIVAGLWLVLFRA